MMADNSCEPVVQLGAQELNQREETQTEAPARGSSHLCDEPPPPPPPRPPPSAMITRLPSVGDRGPNQKLTQKELRLNLVQAIERGELAAVHHVMTQGIQLDCVILFNKTPLTYAIELEAFEIAKTLVKAGADVNAREPIAGARQPLHVAVNCPNTDVLEFLLQHGADVDGRDGCGATPIMLASYSGQLQTAQLLQAYGADLKAEDFVGRTAVHRAVEGQHEDVVSFLLACGADVDARDHFGWTALFHSIVFGHVDMISFLLSQGISVNTVDSNHRCPLIVACNQLCPHNIRVVLSTALDFHKRERKIPTSALHAVLSTEDCTRCEFAIIKLLVNTGAHLSAISLHNLFHHCPNLASQRKHPLLHYLILSGCVWVQEDFAIAAALPFIPQLMLWMEEQRSLQQQCRIVVRTQLSAWSPNHDIQSAVNRLPVPAAVKNFLNILDFVDMYPHFRPCFSSPPQFQHVHHEQGGTR